MCRHCQYWRLPAILALLALLAACGAPISKGSWDHIVVVWEENRSASEVSDLPFIAQLRASGRSYSHSYGLGRPSQPNYIAFFAGSFLGVADDADHELSGSTLYSRFAEAGLTMSSYAEGLPSEGWRGSISGSYVRKHNPAASFASVPDWAILPFSDFPPDFTKLPRLSLVIPDLSNDMHDGTPGQGDDWLRTRLGPYAAWAAAHRSLLILSFDEPSTAPGVDVATTPILTVMVGEGIAAGSVEASHFDHYGLSDFVLDSFALPRLVLGAK